MSDQPILRVAVNVPLSREFDYFEPAGGPVPGVGARVRVPFGRRQQVGVVLSKAAVSDVPATKLKRCSQVLDTEALLSKDDLWLIRFVSDYYHHPIGEVVAAALPSLLRQGKPLHPTVEKVIATDLAATADLESLIRRAPKQAELLETLLDAGGDGLDTDLLNDQLPNWRRAAKGLLEKGLIGTIETTIKNVEVGVALQEGTFVLKN